MKPLYLLAALLLLVAGAVAFAPGVATAATPAASSSAVTGNVTGPSVVATSTNATYFINGSGGPAFENGSRVGNLSWYASVSGTNTTVVTLVPSSGNFTNETPANLTVETGTLVQDITLQVEIASTNSTANVTTNVTEFIHIVQPYVLTMHLHVGAAAAIHEFNLTVALDGVPVGRVHIPPLAAGANQTVEFLYATLGLSPGEHTFTVSLVAEHGLVTFAGGATTMTVSFFVPGAPPSYTVWYVAGIVAFFGALFIIVTRVAARRRPVTKK